MAHHLTVAIQRFEDPSPTVNYASYRARLGLTIAILASDTRPELATTLLRRVATETINSADGYAARDVLGYRELADGISATQRATLRRIATEAGLGISLRPYAAYKRKHTTLEPFPFYPTRFTPPGKAVVASK